MGTGSIALMVLVNLAWALNTVVSKLAVGPLGAPPLFYAGARGWIVAVVLLPLLRPLPQRLGAVLLTGLAISGGSFALLYMGLITATPSAASIVALSGAPLTVLFAILLLGERVGWRRSLGIGLTFGGVVLAMTGPGRLEMDEGLWLVFASALVGALGSVFVKRLEVDSFRLQAWASVASVAVLMPLSLAAEPNPLPAVTAAPRALAGCLLFAAVVVSIGAHGTYYRLLQRHDANAIVPLTLLNPLFTVALGAWLTDDPVGPRLLAGGAVALAGVAIILLRPSGTIPKPALTTSKD
ncbi:MAG: DMT family transporter [Qipengyuania sp.]|nr:DMT family transporter [Qipengyuania sp.]